MRRPTTPTSGGLTRIGSGRRLVLLSLIILCTAVGAGAGVLLGNARAGLHPATATVLVNPLDGNPFSPEGRGDDLINLESEAQLVASDQVAGRVASREDGDVTSNEVLEGLSVSVPPNTQTIEIGYSSTSTAVSERRAQAFAVEFLANRQDRAQVLLDERASLTQTQIVEQNAQLAALVGGLGATTDATVRSLTTTQIDGVNAQIADLQSQLTQLATGSVDPGEVISSAVETGAAARQLAPLLFGVVGAILGLGVSSALIYLRTRSRYGLRRADDVTDAGMDLIVTLSPEDMVATSLIATDDAGSFPHLPPPVRAMRTAILGRAPLRPVSVMFAAGGQSMCGGQVALGFAVSTAMAELSTILIDVASGSDTVTAQLGATDLPGLSELLTGTAELDRVLLDARGHLRFLAVGTAGGVALDDLVQSPRMEQVVRACLARAEVVVITAGYLGSTTAQAVKLITDGVVVDLEQDVVRRGEVNRVRERAGDSLFGVAFVEGRRRPSRWSRTTTASSAG